MKVDSSSQRQEAQVSNGQDKKTTWQFNAYLGQHDKVEGFAHSESEDELEDECREDAPDDECREDIRLDLSSGSKSSFSRDVLGASISNSFDKIVNAPKELYFNDASASRERQGPSSLSLSFSSGENHLEQTTSETTSEIENIASGVKSTSTEETNESGNSGKSRESARSAASIFDDEESVDESIDGSVEDEDGYYDDIEADEPTNVKRRSRIVELKEQLGLHKVSASESEESDSSESTSTTAEMAGITNPAPSMDSAYDGEVEISGSATADSISLNQELSSEETNASTGIHSILVKSNSDEKKKKNKEKRVQFYMSSVEDSAPQQEVIAAEPEPKSFWDVLDNFLVNTDFGILDKNEKDETLVVSKGGKKALLDDIAKEVKIGSRDASSASSQNSDSDGRVADQFPVVDFKQIDKLIAASHRYPNRLPSIPECAEQSFDVPDSDEHRLTEEERRMGLSALADMSVTSNLSESETKSHNAVDSGMETQVTEAKKEKKGFFNAWNCGNLKCVTPDTKDMCGPTMKLPGMIALQAMNNIPITNESMIHWTDSEQQNESISRSIQMANEHVNGTRAYLSMIDGVDSEDDDTVLSDNTSQTSNVADENFESPAISDQNDAPVEAAPKLEREEPPGSSIHDASTSPKEPILDNQEEASPSSPREAISENQKEVSHLQEEPTNSSSDVKNPFTSRDDAIPRNGEERTIPAVRKAMDPPTSPKPTQQVTGDMEISAAHKFRQQKEQTARAERKPDPESFEASKPKTKAIKKSSKADPKPEAAKKKKAKGKKLDPTESKSKAGLKPKEAKKKTTTKSKNADPTECKPTQAKQITVKSKAIRTKPTPESKKLDPTESKPMQAKKAKKATIQSNAGRTKPSPETAGTPTTKPEAQPGTNQDCPIVLVEEEEQEVPVPVPAEEMRDDSDSSTSSSQHRSSSDNNKNESVEDDSSAAPTADYHAISPELNNRLTSRIQKKLAERQQLKEKLLSQMPPLYALKPDEIALLLDVGTREYLSHRRRYNLAYEQARWCVLAAQSNTDQSLTVDMVNEILRDECQRFS
ncbi:MAG: hypothetical protein SGBAC_012293 [Bacillariaceae sp.]